IAAFQSGFSLHEPITELLQKLVPCFSLGIVPLPGINGVNVNRINAGVFWTLQYEWGFYLVLPFLALLATPGRLIAFCMVALLGTISYSVYLLHGIVLFIIFRLVSLLLRIDEMSLLGYWSLVCGCGVLTILISGLTYRFVEHPFLPGSSRSGEGCEDVKASPA